LGKGELIAGGGGEWLDHTKTASDARRRLQWGRVCLKLTIFEVHGRNERRQAMNSRLAGSIVAGAVAFGLLLATMMPGAAPGDSANYLAGFAGLDPFPPMSHFLWGYLVRLLQWLPGPTLAWWANLLSVLCGAGCVALLFYLVSRIPHVLSREESEAYFDRNRAGLLSAAVASGLALTAVPFWLVGTRAHPALFDLLLLLGLAATLLVIAERARSPGWLYAWSALYGVAFTEYATMVVAAPLFASAVVWVMLRRGWLRFRGCLLCGLCFLAALSLYGVYAWQYMQTDAFHWRDFHTYLDSLWFVWRDQYRAIAKSVPRVGWLLLFMTVVLPAIMVFYPKSRAKEGRLSYSLFMHGVLSVVLLVVFLNTRLSPWRLLGWRPLLVAPYVLAAVWGGYLAGYWWVVLGHPADWKFRRSEFAERLVRRIFPVGVLAAVAILGVRNAPEAVVAAERSLADLGRDMALRMEDGAWVLTSGLLDNVIRLEAAARGKRINVISLPSYGSEAYGRYVASLFTNQRLRVLARIGVEPLLREWLKTDRSAGSRIASVENADLLGVAGLYPLPDCSLYRGATDITEVDAAAMLEAHRRWWRLTVPRAVVVGNSGDVRGRWYARVLSKEANNFGVFLEDAGMPEKAAEAYRVARKYDTNNISALLNLYALSRRQDLEDAEQVEKEFAALLENLPRKLRIWSLSYHYGYVRYPEAFVDRGLAWALSGKPRRAITDLERALQLGASATAVQLALGQLYFQEAELSASREAYLQVLEKDPENMGALLGLARIAMRQGDFDSARGYLDRLEELGLEPGVLLLERVALESLLGNRNRSRDLLRKLIKLQPRNAKAWAALAIIAQSEEDSDTVEQCLMRLSELNAAQYPSIRRVIGQLAAAQGKLDVARQHFEEVLRVRPGDQQALELLLTLDLHQRMRSAAEKHAAALLRADPDNYLGNMIMGGQHYLRREYALAESCFRTALRRRRTDWALNELAWTLHQLGRDREALPLAREALRLNRENAMAWDTLGTVLTALGHYEEADKALRESLRRRPDDAVVLLHVARLRWEEGRRREAQKLIESLLLRGNELPAELYEEVRDLARRLRPVG